MTEDEGKREKAKGGRLALPSALLLFVVLATLNSAGYRYGASDQAFYVPAVLLKLDPDLFPRDTPLIKAQADLTGFDEVGSALVHATHLRLPPLLLILYVLTLALLGTGLLRIGATLYRERWTALALLAALTLRHAIARSGTNTLEGYFHPRQLAFALGVLALGAFLRGGLALPAALVVAAGILHPTTAAWFAAWLIVATFVSERRMRLPVVAVTGLCAAAAAWALTAGPLAGRLIVMDDAWLRTLAAKDYLFPLRWPAWVWVSNLAYVPLILWGYLRRRSAGVLSARETGLVAGCLSLITLFLAALLLQSQRLALAYQLQPARMFWMLDLLATVYVIWLLSESGPAATPDSAASSSVASTFRRKRRPATIAMVLATVSLGRGLYHRVVEFPDRPTIQATIPDNDWGRVMAWARATDKSSGWLADPNHAARYGTSVRVAGERDVLVEAIKDAAIGLYERRIALQVQDRIAAVGEFGSLSAARARALAATYRLDYLVADRPFDLPVAFRSGSLTVYRLR